MNLRQQLHNVPAMKAVRISAPTAFLMILLAVILMDSARAEASPFTLGAFDTYGLLVNTGASGGDINTAPVNANIGIGNVTGPVNLHNEVVNGKVDCSGSCASAVSGGAITGTQPVSRGGAQPSGSPASVNSNVADVTAAINTALALSSTYGAEAAMGTVVSINTGSQTINAASGFLDSSGAELFTSSTFAIGNGNTLTINGTASDYVVLNITGNSTGQAGRRPEADRRHHSRSGADQFHRVGRQRSGRRERRHACRAFLIPNMGVQLNSLTIDGHLFGGEAGHNFQFVSNAFIDQPAVTRRCRSPQAWCCSEPVCALASGACAAGPASDTFARYVKGSRGWPRNAAPRASPRCPTGSKAGRNVLTLVLVR